MSGAARERLTDVICDVSGLEPGESEEIAAAIVAAGLLAPFPFRQEFGHMRLDDGHVCTCGPDGCPGEPTVQRWATDWHRLEDA